MLKILLIILAGTSGYFAYKYYNLNQSFQALDKTLHEKDSCCEKRQVKIDGPAFQPGNANESSLSTFKFNGNYVTNYHKLIPCTTAVEITKTYVNWMKQGVNDLDVELDKEPAYYIITKEKVSWLCDNTYKKFAVVFGSFIDSGSYYDHNVVLLMPISERTDSIDNTKIYETFPYNTTLDNFNLTAINKFYHCNTPGEGTPPAPPPAPTSTGKKPK